MTQIFTEPLSNIADSIRRRELSPVEVITAHLRRIEDINPKLNAIVTISPNVLEQAREAEVQIMRGENPGVLHGVPITIKDTIETAQLLSTSGSSTRSSFVPDRDAPVVALLKQAGAIILGKTNAAEMAMDYTADNPVFGRTNNPYDLSMTPGGSSGGEAAAIATGMSPGGLGSDLAGSIRIPSHFCGIAGLKPTVGSVPGEGQFPPSTGPYSLGAVIGPMARYTRDLRILFDVMRSGARRSRMQSGLKGMRVAWYTDDGVAPVTPETASVVSAAASALTSAGLLCEQRRPPHLELGHQLWLGIFSRASVVQLRHVYSGRENEAGKFVSWRLANADKTPAPSLDEYISTWMERDRLREELLAWMETTPLLLAPVGATPAYKHDTLKVTVGDVTLNTFRAFSYSQAFNVFDLPVVTVPVGYSNEGLPIGVQIVGPPFEEELVMDVAAVLEEAFGGWRMPNV